VAGAKMSKKENVEHINTKIASGFEKIEKKLAEAKNIAELFEFLCQGIETEFNVPFVWLTLTNVAAVAPVIEAVKSSEVLNQRLNVINPQIFNDFFSAGLKPVLVNKNLKQYYKLFPASRKYFAKSLALVPFKVNNIIAGSWNNGDASPERYAPDMESTLLQNLSKALSVRLKELITA
jgi:uncharacterized protein YigA (DUF484 family)